jgi:polysaccharide export outer membrane protein
MLTAIFASTVGAQNPTPAASPPTSVVVPGQRTAAQNAAAAMGKQVSNDEIARAIKNSGLTPAQVRARLQQAGFDPKLADPFFAGTVPGGAVSDSSTLAALGSLGFDLGGDETLQNADANPDATHGGAKAEEKKPAAQRRFGRDVFINRSSSFDPEINGPVDASYRLGIGDALQVVLTGQVEQGYQVDVRRDGTVLLQNLGAVPVAGLTLESARALIRTRAARSFSGVADGKTTVDVTVTKLRSNQVRVIGEVERPGAYQVSGLATVFNAISRAGGPTERGSFRNIELRRGGVIINRIDLYDYLLKGDASSDVRTEHGDMIFVPPAMRSVTVAGAMRREGIFELKGNEGFRDLLFFAGGLLPSAATNRIHIDRTLPPDQRRPGVYRVVLDVPLSVQQSELDTLQLQDDDVITVYEIGDLRRNSVVLFGPVNQPGSYEWKPGLTLSQLVTKAQGVLPWALTDRVKVKRQLASSGKSQLFSLDLADSAAARFPLAEFDEVTILDGRDQAQSDRVTVRGAVRAPGTRPWAAELTLKDVIDMSHGFEPWAMSDRVIVTRREMASGKVQVLRIDARDSASLKLPLQPLDEVTVPDARVTNPGYTINVAGAVFQPGTKTYGTGMTLGDAIDLSGGFRPEAQQLELARVRRGRDYSDTSAVVERFDLGDGDRGAWRAIELLRDDRVVVRVSPGYRALGAVTVVGAFRFPGSYVIQSTEERLSDIIRRAGGPLPNAFLNSLSVIRNGRPVPIRYESIVARHHDDILAVDGDQIKIEVQSEVVLVGGGVQRQVSVPFRSGWGLTDYIDAAGGFADSANTSNIVVTYASGAVKHLKKHFWVTTSTPELEPGATITVGIKAEDKSGDWGKGLAIVAQGALTFSTLLLSYLALKR